MDNLAAHSSPRRKPFAECSFLIVGVVRNVEHHLANDVETLASAFAGGGSLKWLLIESDSDDKTLDRLRGLRDKVDNFRFLSLGIVRDKLRLRAERIAYCRNKYVEELRKNNEYADVDYVVVADFDGINVLLTKSSVLSCWKRNDWDVCTANQAAPYYDIWALRHEKWAPNDCWEQFRFLNKYRLNVEKNADVSIYSKMITIPVDSDWIDVDSAFGGLAIYRREVFDESSYAGLTDNGDEVCEHVPLHTALKKKGFRIYINPEMINAAYTEHSAPLLFMCRAKNKIKRHIGMFRDFFKYSMKFVIK